MVAGNLNTRDALPLALALVACGCLLLQTWWAWCGHCRQRRRDRLWEHHLTAVAPPTDDEIEQFKRGWRYLNRTTDGGSSGSGRNRASMRLTESRADSRRHGGTL